MKPKFTKRHHQAIAQAIKESWILPEKSNGDGIENCGVGRARRSIADMLQEDNPNFNCGEFFKQSNNNE